MFVCLFVGEREKVKQNYADAVQQIAVLTNTSNQLKERNHTLIQENNKLTGEVARSKLRAKRNSSREHTFSPPAAGKDLTSSLSNFIPVRTISKFNKGIYANQILYLLIVTMGHSIDPVGCYLINPVSLT